MKSLSLNQKWNIGIALTVAFFAALTFIKDCSWPPNAGMSVLNTTNNREENNILLNDSEKNDESKIIVLEEPKNKIPVVTPGRDEPIEAKPIITVNTATIFQITSPIDTVRTDKDTNSAANLTELKVINDSCRFIVKTDYALLSSNFRKETRIATGSRCPTCSFSIKISEQVYDVPDLKGWPEMISYRFSPGTAIITIINNKTKCEKDYRFELIKGKILYIYIEYK